MLEINQKENESIDEFLGKNSIVSTTNFTFSGFSENPTDKSIYQSVFEQMDTALLILDSNGTILNCNFRAEELLGLNRSLLFGNHIFDIFHTLIDDTQSLPDAFKHFEKYTRKSTDFDLKIQKNRKNQYLNITISKIFMHQDPQYALFIRDVTAQRRSQMRLRDRLEKAELQFREMNHRIKNNLQLVNSIMNLEFDKHKPNDSEAVKSLLKESQNKIYSISLIHQTLCENKALDQINIKRYITQLFNYISGVYSNSTKNIQLEIDDEWLDIPVKEAIYIGLIIDEILTNSFKHAFKNRANGKINIYLKKTKKDATLRILDNGPGFARKDHRQNNSFGMELIFTLVKQLKGKIELKSEGGTEYFLRFPVFI